MNKWFAVISLMLAATAGVFGNGASAGDDIVIRFANTWESESDSKQAFFTPALDAFAERHSGEFELVREVSSGDAIFNKVQVEMAGDNLPDVWTYWGGSRLAELVESDKVLEIGDYLSVTDALDRNQISEGAWSLYKIGDGYYGIPLEGYIAAFLVNKELFDRYGLEYPETYEEMVAVGEVFQENGIIPFAMGSQGGNPSHFWFSEVYTQFAGAEQELLDLPTTNRFATENALKTARLMLDMKENGLFPKDTVANGDWAPSFALYNEGRAAMTYTYPWMLGQMSQDMQEKSEVIAVPRMPGAARNPKNFIGGGAVYGFVVNKESFDDPMKRDALIAFMDFMVSDELLDELIRGGLVPTKSYPMNNDSFNLVMKKAMAFADGLDKVTAHWWNIWDNTAAQVYQSSLDELFAGILSAEDFVDQVQAAFDE